MVTNESGFLLLLLSKSERVYGLDIRQLMECAMADNEASRKAARRGGISLILATLSYPLAIWIKGVGSGASYGAVFWLVADLVPPVLACLLGVTVLWQRWMYGRDGARVGALVLAAAGLILGGLWFFLAFIPTPSLLPVGH